MEQDGENDNHRNEEERETSNDELKDEEQTEEDQKGINTTDDNALEIQQSHEIPRSTQTIPDPIKDSGTVVHSKDLNKRSSNNGVKIGSKSGNLANSKAIHTKKPASSSKSPAPRQSSTNHTTVFKPFASNYDHRMTKFSKACKILQSVTKSSNLRVVRTSHMLMKKKTMGKSTSQTRPRQLDHPASRKTKKLITRRPFLIIEKLFSKLAKKITNEAFTKLLKDKVRAHHLVDMSHYKSMIFSYLLNQFCKGLDSEFALSRLAEPLMNESGYQSGSVQMRITPVEKIFICTLKFPGNPHVNRVFFLSIWLKYFAERCSRKVELDFIHRCLLLKHSRQQIKGSVKDMIAKLQVMLISRMVKGFRSIKDYEQKVAQERFLMGLDTFAYYQSVKVIRPVLVKWQQAARTISRREMFKERSKVALAMLVKACFERVEISSVEYGFSSLRRRWREQKTKKVAKKPESKHPVKAVRSHISRTSQSKENIKRPTSTGRPKPQIEVKVNYSKNHPTLQKRPQDVTQVESKPDQDSPLKHFKPEDYEEKQRDSLDFLPVQSVVSEATSSKKLSAASPRTEDKNTSEFRQESSLPADVNKNLQVQDASDASQKRVRLKLTPELVAQINQKYQEGYSLADIGELEIEADIQIVHGAKSVATEEIKIENMDISPTKQTLEDLDLVRVNVPSNSKSSSIPSSKAVNDLEASPLGMSIEEHRQNIARIKRKEMGLSEEPEEVSDFGKSTPEKDHSKLSLSHEVEPIIECSVEKEEDTGKTPFKSQTLPTKSLGDLYGHCRQSFILNQIKGPARKSIHQPRTSINSGYSGSKHVVSSLKTNGEKHTGSSPHASKGTAAQQHRWKKY